MESDDSDFESTISPEEISGLAHSNLWQCHCVYGESCYCFPESTCPCFNTQEVNAPFTFSPVEAYGAVVESDATERYLGIRDLHGLFRLRIEDTSSERYLCGMFALEISTDRQLNVSLTRDTFMDIFCYDPEMRDFNERRGYRNGDNFYDEQIARVLQIWGRRIGYDELQLGVFVEGDCAIIFGAEDKCVPVISAEEMERERDSMTVWIYNDNAVELHQAGLNHFCGVTVLGMNEEQDESSERGDSTEEGDTTEEESEME